MLHVPCTSDEIMVATGAAEIQPVAPGNRSARDPHDAGGAATWPRLGIVPLGRVVAIGAAASGQRMPRLVAGELVRVEGAERLVEAVVST
jgi:hypothetical protein